ncbi:uncharacterized protein LOC136081473 [Hydra vulgaris]|uniref:Uncharacterized protein LOC136081473 n=1 Tax=Hydra vulgaris TaxID=6087 RepID=A0ABM4C004_HYDVU
MPGANCAIFGCSVSRNHVGLSIFRIPTKDDEYSANWRQKLISVITHDRVIDKGLKAQIEKRNLYICERHYTKDQLLRQSNKLYILYKVYLAGLVDKYYISINIVLVSILETRKFSTTSRKSAEIIVDKKSNLNTQPNSIQESYKSMEEFTKRIIHLNLPSSWNINNNISHVHIFEKDEIHEVTKTDIFIDASLTFILRIYAWHLPSTHEVYKSYDSSMKNITLSNLIKVISSYSICLGVSLDEAKKSAIKHCVPKIYNLTEFNFHGTYQTEYFRSSTCSVLSKLKCCDNCIINEKTFISKSSKSSKRKHSVAKKPAKLNAPISLTSPDRLKLTIQNYRIENKDLKEKIIDLQNSISKSAMTISSSLSDDLISIMSNADQNKISPFMKLFWEEQQKYLRLSPTNVRYHPIIIRYCLSLASKSAAMYDDIRYNDKSGTGFLVLPSRRRLRDYKNYIKPKRGFNKEIIDELKEKTKDFSEQEKFIVILMDEMKIQENLVWDKHTGEIVGYVDLGDADVNIATLPKVDDFATHVLVFLVRSIFNPFKFSLANFATTGATACQIFPLLWKAIGICELNSLKVIAVTCDGASANRKLFKMHFTMTRNDDMNPHVDVTYRTLNYFSLEKRFIYFISDPPHLIKTVRNCLSNSKNAEGTRYMWNGGMFILWNHIADIFYEDRECGLHILPKLTFEHIKLTPYSIMNVKLAAQVLSSTVSKVLLHYRPPEAEGTAKFCALMDSFFDVMNIRSLNGHKFDLKPNLAPFSSLNDDRFFWLQSVFLQYFKDWLKSIEEHSGDISKISKSKMFIAHQTYEGLKITVHSIIESVQFLLQQNAKYVLTERFCQDPIENYFGRQRSLGSRKDNPSVNDFGYNDNMIRNQKVFLPVTGNVISYTDNTSDSIKSC